MRKRVMTFPSCDGRTDIHAVCWTPSENKVQAVVQIVHGMTEFVAVCKVSDGTGLRGGRA